MPFLFQSAKRIMRISYFSVVIPFQKHRAIFCNSHVPTVGNNLGNKRIDSDYKFVIRNFYEVFQDGEYYPVAFHYFFLYHCHAPIINSLSTLFDMLHTISYPIVPAICAISSADIVSLPSVPIRVTMSPILTSGIDVTSAIS